MFYFVLISLWMSVLGLEPASKVVADRYAVYWNRTNARWVSYLRSWYTKTPFHFCHSEAPQSAEYRAKYNAAANWTGSSSRQDRLNKFHWWYNSHKLHCKGELLTKCAIDSRQRYFTVNSMAKLYEGMTRNGARNCENKWSANCYKICTYSLSVVEVNTKNHTNKLISLYSFSYIYIYVCVCVYVCMYKAYICFLMPMFFCFFTSFQ